MQEYVYDSSEHVATCCLGDMFFRKRRLTSASDYYRPSVKSKQLPVDDDDVNDRDNDNETSARLASSTERTLAAGGPMSVNLNSKYQGSSDDNSRGTRLAATADNDSYSHGVGAAQPVNTALSLQDSSELGLPPSYTVSAAATPLSRDDPPVQTAASSADRRPARSRSARDHPGRPLPGGRLAKEHEMLQNMWLESHGRRQQQQQQEPGRRGRVTRRSSSVGSTSGRTVYVVDRSTGTTYRRGRLLGKVTHTHTHAHLSCRANGTESCETVRAQCDIALLIPSVGPSVRVSVQCQYSV